MWRSDYGWAGKKTIESQGGGFTRPPHERNYYIEVRYAKALSVLAALTGRELSVLVNEALADMIRKVPASHRHRPAQYKEHR
jgi:hypothetical protein